MTATSARAIRRPHGQLTHQAIPLRRKARDLLPDGAKVRGVNVSVTAAQQAVSQGPPATMFATMWQQWDPTGTQKMLDHAVEADCNTVRFFGSIYGVFAGWYTRAQYFTLWDQFSGWCQQRGLFLYPTGCDGNAFDQFGAIPSATQQAELLAWAQHMATLPDVIGLDLVQENNSFRESANGLALYQAVKSAGVALPLTYSCSSPLDTGGYFAPGYAADRMDFFDFHIYYANPVLSAFDTNWGGDTRPVLIGEFSHANDGGYYTQQQWLDRYDQVRAVVNHVGPAGQRVAGALAWCSDDALPFFPVGTGSYSPAQNFGLFDYWGNERTWLTAKLKQFPKV